MKYSFGKQNNRRLLRNGLVAVASGLLLGACTASDDLAENKAAEQTPLRLAAMTVRNLNVETRAMLNDPIQDYDAFIEGEKIKAYVVVTGLDIDAPGTSGLVTYKAKHDLGVAMTPDPQPYFLPGRNLNVYAVYPFDETESPSNGHLGSTTFSVQENQHSAEDYRKSDLMYAKLENIESSFDIYPLEFNHKMSKIIVRVPGREGIVPTYEYTDAGAANTAYVTKVELQSVKRTTTMDYLTGTVGTATNLDTLIVYQNDANDVDFIDICAVFPPQTANPSLLFTMSDGHQTRYPIASTDYESGKNYVYNIDVKKIPLPECTVSMNPTTYVTYQSAVHPNISIVYKGLVMIEGVDYTVTLTKDDGSPADWTVGTYKATVKVIDSKESILAPADDGSDTMEFTFTLKDPTYGVTLPAISD